MTSQDRGPSRRAVLKGAVLGAGALWVAPTIDSFTSPAAAASCAGTIVLPSSYSWTGAFPGGLTITASAFSPAAATGTWSVISPSSVQISSQTSLQVTLTNPACQRRETVVLEHKVTCGATTLCNDVRFTTGPGNGNDCRPAGSVTHLAATCV